MKVLTAQETTLASGGLLTLDSGQLTYLIAAFAQSVVTLSVKSLLKAPLTPTDYVLPVTQMVSGGIIYDLCNRYFMQDKKS
jgi:hypothetical protein